MSSSPIRAVIFDLDNCLAAADEAGEALFAPAFDAMRAVDNGTLSQAALADCWRHALDFVARKHGFSDEMLAAGWRAFRTQEVKQPLRGYGDLAALVELPQQRFLVTSGFRRLQESKIDALGVRHLFADIASRHGWRPREVLIVGDNADSEIAAGNALGMPTVQVLRPGVPAAQNAQWRIKNFAELSKLIPKNHLAAGR